MLHHQVGFEHNPAMHGWVTDD